MRRSLLALVFLSVSVFGCATVFRSGKEKVRVESDPAGADLKKGEKTVAQTPAEIEVDRTTTTAVVLQKQGYGEHRGVVKRQLSAGWLTLDLITCLPLL